MPAWIYAYLLLFLLLNAGGLWDDYQGRRPVWHLVCAALATIVLTSLFIAYWHPSFLAFRFVARLAFVAAIAWEVYESVCDYRDIRPDPQLSSFEQKALRVVSISVVTVLILPALVIAGMAAFGVS